MTALFKRSSWCFLLAAMMLWALGAGSARAAISIIDIKVNGGSTANVAAGSQVTLTITVKLDNGSKWRSTYVTTSPSNSAINGCLYETDFGTTGTFTHTFTQKLTAPATQGMFSLNVWVYGHPGCGTSQGGSSATLPNAINTAPAVAALNHVRILHDGSGLNCSPEVMTLRACADASCASPFTGSVSVSLPTLASGAGTWSANPVIFSGGSTTFSLSRSIGGTVVLGGTVNSPAAASTAAVCYKNGVAGDCNLVFGENSCQLDAVEAGTGPNTPIFTRRVNAPIELDVLTLINGVLTSNRVGDVSATIVDASSGTCSTTPLSNTVTMRYNTSHLGRQKFTLTPSAASANARVRLVSSTLIQCSSDNFAIRPSAFTISSTNAVQDATGQSITTSSPLKAGTTDFTLSAASFTGYTGTPRIAPGRVSPAPIDASNPGVAGTISGAFPAASGTSTGTAFRYSEVGYFRLLPYAVYDDGSFTMVDGAKEECWNDSNLGSAETPPDPNVAVNGKIGCYFGSTGTDYFGRFVPDSFVLGPALVLKERRALAACTAPGFSYFGEEIGASVPLLAKNGLGDPTSNYTGRFNRFDAATQLNAGVINDPPSAARTPIPACVGAGAHPCVTYTPVSGAFEDGEAVLNFALTPFRAAAAVAPFENFKLGIAPIDADGVRLANYNIDTVNLVPGTPNRQLVGATRLRHGRLKVENAYGSELLNLTMRLTAQFWNGSAYVTNALDNCTPTTGLDPGTGIGTFSLGLWRGGISAANMNQSHFTSTATLSGGTGKVVLLKPGPTRPATRGSVVVNSVLPYLPGSGLGTFGLYKAGPVIYVRETY